MIKWLRRRRLRYLTKEAWDAIKGLSPTGILGLNVLLCGTAKEPLDYMLGGWYFCGMWRREGMTKDDAIKAAQLTLELTAGIFGGMRENDE